MEVLLKNITTMQDDEKKLFRNELEKYKIKIKESDNILVRYDLSEEILKSLDLNNVQVFATYGSPVIGVKMLVSNETDLNWNRNE